METKVENRKTRVGEPNWNWQKDRQGQHLLSLGLMMRAIVNSYCITVQQCSNSINQLFSVMLFYISTNQKA